MPETFFPTLEEALYLYTVLIERFGGTHGVRDYGLLESALARPKSGYYSSLSQQAAALFHSLISNHCFLDGNKRMALALTAIFLRVNSYKFQIPEKSGEKFIVNKIIKNKLDITEITKWLEKHMVKL